MAKSHLNLSVTFEYNSVSSLIIVATLFYIRFGYVNLSVWLDHAITFEGSLQITSSLTDDDMLPSQL